MNNVYKYLRGIYEEFKKPGVLVKSCGSDEELTTISDPRIQFDIKGNILFGIHDNRYSNCAIADSIKADRIVIIPEGIEIIGQECFRDLKCVKKVICPKSLKKIAQEAFMDCYVEEIEFNSESNLIEIGDRAFYNSRLRYFYIPKSVKVLGMEAFYECNYLQELRLNSLLQAIPRNCFFKCRRLKSLYLTENIVEIGEGAFKDSGLRIIHFNPNLKIIGNQAFSSVNLECLEIPSTVEEIGDRAFADMRLAEVYLPSSIRKMGVDIVTNFKHLTVDNSDVLSLFIKGSNSLLETICYNNARVDVDVLSLHSSDNYKNGNFYYDYREYNSKPFKFLVDDNNLFKYNDSGKCSNKLDKFIFRLKAEEQLLKSNLNEKKSNYNKQYLQEVETNNDILPDTSYYEVDSKGQIWENGDLVTPAQQKEIEKSGVSLVKKNFTFSNTINNNAYKITDNPLIDANEYEVDSKGRIWKNGDLVTPAQQKEIEKSGVSLVKKKF